MDSSSKVNPFRDKCVYTFSSNRPLLSSSDSPICHDNESGVHFSFKVEVLMKGYEEVKEEIKKKGDIATVIKLMENRGEVLQTI